MRDRGARALAWSREQVGLRSPAVVQVVLRLGMVEEEGVEPRPQRGGGRLRAGLAVEVDLLARVVRKVVELKRAVGMAVDVLPVRRADDADILVLEVHHVV